VETSPGRQWSVFYAYTAWSIVIVLAMFPLGAALALGVRVPGLVDVAPVASSVLLAQIVLSAWSGHRSLRAWSRAELSAVRDRWGMPQVGRLPSDLALVVAAAPSLLIVVLHLLDLAAEPLVIISLVLLAVTVLMRWRWEIGAVGTAVCVLALLLAGRPVPEVVALGALVIALVLTVRLSLWLAAMVRELDDARQAQAQLAVAEERLRFARDLHDVTGRDLSVIAVKAELVAQLAEREDARAVEHSREVAQIARGSLSEIRGLVRGYREADLATELRGTASLLRSAQVEVTIDGAAEDVPARHRGTAAWVLREAGTNILRHADPSAVRITLGADGIALVNDGAPGPAEVPEGSGLTGMRERLARGSSLGVRREGGTFTLDLRFDPSGEPR